MHEYPLSCPEAAVFEQSLPCGETGHYEGRPYREVNVGWQRCEVACLNRHILRQCAVAIPVRKTKYPLPDGKARCAIAKGSDHSGHFVAGNRRRAVTTRAIGPGRRPRQLIPGEAGRVNLNDNVVY